MAIVLTSVSGALTPKTTTSKAVVAAPSTTSKSSTSTSSSARSSSSITSTSIVSSTTSSSVRSTTSSSVASSTTSRLTTSSVPSTTSIPSTSLLSSSTTSSSATATASAAAASTGLSSLAKSLIIAGICVASVIALIVAVGFLLRRRRDGRRDRRNRNLELDGYGKDGRSSPQYEKDQPGVGDDRFMQALGRGERPSGRAGAGIGGIYGASAGAGAMYAGSEASLQQPPMAANDGGWGSAGGYDVASYPPQQSYSPGGFAPPHSASQQYLVPRSASPAFSENPQRPYTPQDQNSRSASPYGQQHPPPPVQQQPSYYDSSEQQPQDPYQDPTPEEAQAMAGVGGDPELGGALVPGGALDETGVQMRVIRSFSPTADDELAIEPGGLMMMHQSYEDGWSLCSAPGSKKRGVVPRDCLALPSTVPESFLPPPLSPPSEPRVLPQLPSQSFSSSNLYDPSANRQSQYEASSSQQEQMDENNHPLAPPPTFGVAMGYEDHKGRPLSVVVRDEDGTEREVMRSELGASGGSFSGEFGGLDVPGIPKSGSHLSLTPSERQERRSSLMDSVRAAGAYLEQGGASGTHL